MKVIAFAASSSKQSINKQLVTYAASLVDKAEVEVLDLNDYELPLFSVDIEKELGQPALAQAFIAKLGSADALVISFAEHNGNYSAAWKNLFDWCSRIEQKIFQKKPTILLSTSPGERGGATVMDIALNALPRFAAEIKGSMSLPSFYENFDADSGRVIHTDYDKQLHETMNKLA
ncbi:MULTISPECIES: NAD(P)H-dependent oxidoreductase [unclassified Methylophaga]|jgi:NAD(P)H-dependent FMN reductase|uniref:NADPH-dependent FMN reductase n=1 Tax=unclassified Methylophaga TaxID=2629249 RepID=UPI000C919C00|nr:MULTISPECIES: NAD(P)H-dependent oxidoreductase [unclassified Methylophaga]MAK65654.1 NADPH-dependent FMN reductase [Methylophaga sp.]MAY16377.1 NADPH-dependent FMN reductase [Methylophaga sp.]HAO23897.1 NADPH-dependent FMN reductase [Methylophaga sp.]HCD04065.1 NADPH-dependent FMN reductase [Methylophaga sp.]|tara:strand:+ start:2276 stop:2800 length:525 start_codon:yes stop_codon:yes gene_type:complete